ncbi:cGMP-dependent protein kinase 1-like isoform X3 [Chrysemys picta bellii]|uniref:cGMP-dependent protein kinase 1-like isoform X3 n=1 Tax=Chrysemys picta bellii TaxID=8478 RepID=UPI0032B2BDFF
MDQQLRERWLQEEREYLQSMARQRGSQEQGGAPEDPGAGSREIADQADADGGRRPSRSQPIVPEPLASDEALQVPHVPKSPRDRSLIAGAVERNDFLRLLGEGQADAMVQSFMPAWHGPGQTVLAEGTDGDAMYIVAEGELSVTQRGCPLRTLLPGDVFGELAILYHCKRTATVTALTQVRLWAIDRQTYRTIVTSQAKRRRAEILDSLREAPSLQGLADAQLSKLLDSMEECTFAHDEVIVREGDEGNNFYIILRGEVRVSRRMHGREEQIRVLRAGEHFGELSLLRNIRRTATCRAHGEVACITVTKEDFQEICPFCPTPRQLSEPDVAVLEVPSLPEPGRAPCPETTPAPLRLQDLAAVRYEDGQHQGLPVVLGTGGFGRVELVRGRGLLFALKRIRKEHVVRRRQQEHVRTEKRVLERSRCPFIVGLFGTFRDSQYVYMLLEFCQGGELWTKLREVRCFEEEVAVFCSACVVEALDYLHGNGIIYRDLKPENLMLDKWGYIKLSQGWLLNWKGARWSCGQRKCPSCMALTCGTPCHMTAWRPKRSRIQGSERPSVRDLQGRAMAPAWEQSLGGALQWASPHRVSLFPQGEPRSLWASGPQLPAETPWVPLPPPRPCCLGGSLPIPPAGGNPRVRELAWPVCPLAELGPFRAVP